MKFVSLFNKIPKHKRFSYEPRFYDEREDEMREREKRIRAEISVEREREANASLHDGTQVDPGYRTRIAGSFKSARRTASRQSDPSAALMRLVILLVLTVLIIGYLQFGPVAAYGLFLIVPVYLFMKFRNLRKPGEDA
ncbi:MAG: hypothetical protein HC859_00090 [Bacteroidia bacterium]|nr:hypothetical protein [Bacteroidia bacterium]